MNLAAQFNVLKNPAMRGRGREGVLERVVRGPRRTITLQDVRQSRADWGRTYEISTNSRTDARHISCGARVPNENVYAVITLKIIPIPPTPSPPFAGFFNTLN